MRNTKPIRTPWNSHYPNGKPTVRLTGSTEWCLAGDDEGRFDSNCITPGTPFMCRLQVGSGFPSHVVNWIVCRSSCMYVFWIELRVFLNWVEWFCACSNRHWHCASCTVYIEYHGHQYVPQRRHDTCLRKLFLCALNDTFYHWFSFCEGPFSKSRFPYYMGTLENVSASNHTAFHQIHPGASGTPGILRALEAHHGHDVAQCGSYSWRSRGVCVCVRCVCVCMWVCGSTCGRLCTYIMSMYVHIACVIVRCCECILCFRSWCTHVRWVCDSNYRLLCTRIICVRVHVCIAVCCYISSSSFNSVPCTHKHLADSVW